MNEGVTIIIPTLNEEKNILPCLESLLNQDYPCENMEVLVADAGSTDRTLEILNDYSEELNLTILHNELKDCHFGKLQGIRQATNELIVFLDADNEIAGRDWLKSNIQVFKTLETRYSPLVIESNYYDSPKDTVLCNYLMTNLYIADPLSFYTVEKPEYLNSQAVSGFRANIYKLSPSWPTGANGFLMRKTMFQDHPIQKEWFAESDYFADVASKETLYLARVSGVGIYHHYVGGWRSYYRKRLKIGRKYFTRKMKGDNKSWVANSGMSSLVFYTIYLNLFIPPLIESVFRSLRDKNPKWLIHPFAGIVSTWAYLHAYLEVSLFKKKAF